MKKLLHIIATPRGGDSRTLKVTQAFLETFRSKNKGCEIETIDLFKEELPPLTIKRVDGKYLLLGGKDLYGEAKDAWQEIIAEIDRFKAADAYLISTPMWNFGIPYKLKHYIDIIVQPKYLFRYTETGVEGLVKGKKMVVITSRGGAYNTPETRPFDQQEPYLRTVFGYVGLTDIRFVIAEPMDALGPDVQKEKIEAAKVEAIKAAENFSLG